MISNRLPEGSQRKRSGPEVHRLWTAPFRYVALLLSSLNQPEMFHGCDHTIVVDGIRHIR